MKLFDLIIFFITTILVFTSEVNGQATTDKKGTNYYCTEKKGQCMTINACKSKGGKSLINQALCSSKDPNVRCCVVEKQNGTTKKNVSTKKSGTTNKNNATNKSSATGNSENRCIEKKGQCLTLSDCSYKGGRSLPNQGLCPGGDSNVRCCVVENKNGNQKTQCELRGGQCMAMNACKSKGGESLKNQKLCPNSSSNVRCCVFEKQNGTTKKNGTTNKNSATGNSVNHCINRGGQCMTLKDCSNKGGKSLINQALCPSNDPNVRCCINEKQNGTTKKNVSTKKSGTTNKNSATNKSSATGNSEIHCINKGGQCMTMSACSKKGGKTMVNRALCPGNNANVRCCVVKGDKDDKNSKCAKRGGQCTTQQECNNVGGELLNNLNMCLSAKYNRCCIIPKPEEDRKSLCYRHGGICSYEKQCNNIGGQLLKNKSMCPRGKYNRCCVLPDPENDTTSQCYKHKGKCMSLDACTSQGGSALNNLGICPPGENNRCCMLPEKKGSGAIDCNIDHSTIASAAVAYAYETKDMGRGNDGTALYVAVKNVIFPEDPYFQSCDRGVAVAVHWSGADDDFDRGDVPTQYDYMMSSEKWTLVGSYDQHYGELQPGDVVILRDQHIVLYVGNEEIRKKYPNSDAEFVSASLNTRSPGCGDQKDAYMYQGYDIFRYVGDYSGSHSKSFTGCASGTSQ